MIATGGTVMTAKGLPDSWTKPIVNSVLLPAHALTSADTDSLPVAFSAPGGSTFTVGEGVTTINVEMSGGGGGSGGSYAGTGGAGGDGELIRSTITVVPGDVLTITVGAGGAGGAAHIGTPGHTPATGGGGGGLSSVGALLASGGGGGGGEGPGGTAGGDGEGPNGGAGGPSFDGIHGPGVQQAYKKGGEVTLLMESGPSRQNGEDGGAGGGAAGAPPTPSFDQPGKNGDAGYVRLS